MISIEISDLFLRIGNKAVAKNLFHCYNSKGFIGVTVLLHQKGDGSNGSPLERWLEQSKGKFDFRI